MSIIFNGNQEFFVGSLIFSLFVSLVVTLTVTRTMKIRKIPKINLSYIDKSTVKVIKINDRYLR